MQHKLLNMVKPLKNVLNLYSSSRTSHVAFYKFILCKDNNTTDFDTLSCTAITSTKIMHFRFFNGYEDAKSDLLSRKWNDINFFVELPLNIKRHFLSRIRQD